MDQKTPKLLRELGLKEALAIGLGTMIGAGIFVLPAIVVERAGQAAAISYLLAGLVCIPVAMIISELVTGMPRAGGSYTFIAEALGPLAGSIVGPANWLGLTFANGFYLIAAGHYLALFLPIPPWSVALIVGLFFIWLNYRGAKMSGGIQILVVIILVSILSIFVIVGMLNHPEIPRESFPIHGWGPVIGSIGLIIVSFTGFENIATIAEEVKQPKRTLPIAIISSVAIVTVLYALLILTATGLMPPGEISSNSGLLVDAARLTYGPIGQAVMLIAALLATLSSANAATMSSSRISYGMGRDQVLPGWFGKAHSKFKTPANGILFTGGLAVVLSLTGEAETLAEISSVMFMVSYALLSISVLVMHRVKPSWYKPSFRAPLYPVLPFITIALVLSVILTMNNFSKIAGMGLLALCLVWYFFWVRKHAHFSGALVPLLERERPMEKLIEAAGTATHNGKHEVLIPLWQKAKPLPLLELAAALTAGDDEPVINVLNMIIAPPQVPLDHSPMASSKYFDDPGKPLSEAIVDLTGKGISVNMLHRAVRAMESGTVAYLEAHPNIALVLTSWTGALSSRRIYESPTKNVLVNAPCDVAILLPRNFSRVKKILIPVGGGPHARLGLRLASQIARGEEAELTAFRVLRPDEELDLKVEEEGLKRVVEDVLKEDSSRVTTKIVISDKVIEAILKTAREGSYDLLVIGASEEWQIKSLLVGSLPDAVADQAPCSVLLVRRYEPVSISTARRILGSLRGWG